MNKTNNRNKVYLATLLAIMLIVIILIIILSIAYYLYNNNNNNNNMRHYTMDDLPALEESARSFTSSYIENKYNFVPEIINVTPDIYQIINDEEKYPTGRFLLTCSDDNREFIVRYYNDCSVDLEYAEDNYQQKEITEGIYNYYVKEIGKEPAKYYISYGMVEYKYDKELNKDNTERAYFTKNYYDGNNINELLEYSDATCVFEYIEDVPNISGLDNSDNWNIANNFAILNFETTDDFNLLKGDFNSSLYSLRKYISENAFYIKDVYLYSHLYDIDTYSSLDIREYENLKYLCWNKEDYNTISFSKEPVADKYLKKFKKYINYDNTKAISDTYSINGTAKDAIYVYIPITEEYEKIAIQKGKKYQVAYPDELNSDNYYSLFLNDDIDRSDKEKPLNLDIKLTLLQTSYK